MDCNTNETAAEFAWNDSQYRVNGSANVTLRNTGTAWLPPALIMAMRKGLDLRVDSAVDESTLQGAETAQNTLHEWWPNTMRKVNLVADSTQDKGHGERGVGCFFSGGLDSFYSAVKHQPDITHLIFVHGFDIFLNSHSRRHYEKSLEGVREAAAEMGKHLIEYQTNIRRMFEMNGGWDVGFGLAHVALSLADHLHTVYIPAGRTEGNLAPRGTHPDLDPLWSSSNVQLIHDGLEADRVAKAATAKESPAAMQHLRVCFWNRSDALNCGECEKCVRTAINMRIVGAADKCRALPPIDAAKALSKIPTDNPSAVYFLRDNLRALQNSDRDDPELESALESALHRSALQKATARSWYIFTVVKVLGLTLREKAYQAIIARRGDTD
ncbi:hypothetical protein [Tomitella gaofuii]|uniref:hypothetical protein n=2 Tax=Tomitella gaofuii TaxID=2760083 RepID=UPI0020C026DE|nr:hypothetical protein [Tomitella gaofuii]